MLFTLLAVFNMPVMVICMHVYVYVQLTFRMVFR